MSKKRREVLYEAQKSAKPVESNLVKETPVSVLKEPSAPYRPVESTGKTTVVSHVGSVTDEPRTAAFTKDEEEMFSGTLRENQKLDEERKLAEISKQAEAPKLQEKEPEVQEESTERNRKYRKNRHRSS